MKKPFLAIPFFLIVPAALAMLVDGHVADSTTYSTGMFHACSQMGDAAGDQTLNALKNRDKAAPDYTPMTVTNIIASVPAAAMTMGRTPRANWTQAALDEVRPWENTAVVVQGYVISARDEGPESCNCHDPNFVDTHIWFADDPQAGMNDRGRDSMVVEVSPRLKAAHPNWVQHGILAVPKGTKFQLKGWLMFDQEHHDQLPGVSSRPTRASLWEIHPITSMQVQDRSGHWVDL